MPRAPKKRSVATGENAAPARAPNGRWLKGCAPPNPEGAWGPDKRLAWAQRARAAVRRIPVERIEAAWLSSVARAVGDDDATGNIRDLEVLLSEIRDLEKADAHLVPHAADLAREVRHLLASFEAFAKAAWHVVEPGTKLVWGRHLSALCLHLEAVYPRRVIRNLIVNVPPRHTKSVLASVLWPAWLWALDPSLHFLSASYALDLSSRDSRKTRELIESDWYRTRFPHVVLAKDQNRKDRYATTEQGERYATSVGGSVTGEGGHVRLLDDPHNVLETFSPTMRERVYQWHQSTWSTRVAGDPEEACSVVIQQRCHENDLTGHLLREGGWAHLCLPAEWDEPRPPTPIGWVDWRTTPGQLLWPERFTAEELARVKVALGSYGVAGQLQQRPSPLEGGLFRREHWRRWTVLPKLDFVLSSWDPSNSERPAEGSSYVVGQCWGVAGPCRYLLDQVRARLSPLATEQAIRDADAKWSASYGKPRVTVVENKAAGPSVMERLRQVLPGVEGSDPKGSKEARAAAVSPLVEAGNVFLPAVAPWVQDFVEEAAAFPAGANDDQIDAATQALLWVDAHQRRSAVIPLTVGLIPSPSQWLEVNDG